jgi:hypothetical protein
MSLRYGYYPFRLGQPVVSLAGRWVRPRPLASVTLIGPSGSLLREGLLDTGADDTVFPESWAAAIGVDLTIAPVGQASGVGLVAVPIRYAQVTLRMAQRTEHREWTAWVGFTPAPLRRPLLGFAGVLQFFTATFHGDREEVELAVNSLYRGT